MSALSQLINFGLKQIIKETDSHHLEYIYDVEYSSELLFKTIKDHAKIKKSTCLKINTDACETDIIIYFKNYLGIRIKQTRDYSRCWLIKNKITYCAGIIMKDYYELLEFFINTYVIEKIKTLDKPLKIKTSLTTIEDGTLIDIM